MKKIKNALLIVISSLSIFLVVNLGTTAWRMQMIEKARALQEGSLSGRLPVAQELPAYYLLITTNLIKSALLCLALFYLFYTIRSVLNQWTQTDTALVKEKIRGWLILPSLGLCLGIVITTLLCLQFLDIFKTARSDSLELVALSSLCANLFILVYMLTLMVHLVQRHQATAKLFIGLFVINILLSLALYLGADSVGINKLAHLYGYSTIKSVLAAFIWIPYFLHSKRVARTFTHA